MSRFIDLVETFDFSDLRATAYREKIDGLLKRFPKYEKDDCFRTVLPHKFPKTADDYISMKVCTRGRYPIFGIYSKRDFDLVGVCVQGNIMYALDDCDLHASLVPDLNVRRLYLGIQDSHLATRETPSYTKAFMCSAISTLSLGYTPEKKSEWCEAIVLLTGMTTQAVRFHMMKRHIQGGLRFLRTYDSTTYDGRYEQDNMYLAMQNRWNKISKAVRKGKYPYIFSHYTNYGSYSNFSLSRYYARNTVSLINDKDKTKRQKIRRKTNRWNGPLGNSIRERKEERLRKEIMERDARIMQKTTDNKFSKKIHGFWYGSVDTFRCKVASVNRSSRPAQMVRANRFLVSTKPPLNLLQDVLQVQSTLASASTYLAHKDIRNEGGLFAFFRALLVPTHKEMADCTQPVFTAAAAFYLCAKRHKLKVNQIKLQSDSNSVLASLKNLSVDHFGISKKKILPEKVKWDGEPRQFVQPSRGRISGALGTCFYPMQGIATRMHAKKSNANLGYSGTSCVLWRTRTLHHEGLRGFYEGLVSNLLNVVLSAKAATKLMAAL